MREDESNAIERGETDTRDNILDNNEEWKITDSSENIS